MPLRVPTLDLLIDGHDSPAGIRSAPEIEAEKAALRSGVDSGTLARWERGKREPAGKFALRFRQFLTGVESNWRSDATMIA